MYNVLLLDDVFPLGGFPIAMISFEAWSWKEFDNKLKLIDGTRGSLVFLG
jgi:hypothetical protein